MEKTLQENKKSEKQALNFLVGKAVSKGEVLTRSFFRIYLPNEKVFYNYRPNWLKFKNDFNLELDIYYPKIKLAIEFQGIHHQLKYQKEKDEFKKNQCKKKKIFLFEIFHPYQLRHKRRLLKKKFGEIFNLPIPQWFKKKLRKYHFAKSGKFKKYAKITKWKIKMEKHKELQDKEIEFNKRRLERRT